MLTLNLSSTLQNKHLLSLKTHQPYYHSTRLCTLSPLQQVHHKDTSFLGFNPLRVSVDCRGSMKKKKHGFGAVCFSAPFTLNQLHFISTVSTGILMLNRGSSINKSFLVPLFTLEAPQSIFSLIRSEYGIWSAFLALLVHLFFVFPDELELPFMASLMVIVAPCQVANLRGEYEGAILSLIIAAYLAFQHFSQEGSLLKPYDQGLIIATSAIVLNVAIPVLILMESQY